MHLDMHLFARSKLFLTTIISTTFIISSINIVSTVASRHRRRSNPSRRSRLG